MGELGGGVLVVVVRRKGRRGEEGVWSLIME